MNIELRLATQSRIALAVVVLLFSPVAASTAAQAPATDTIRSTVLMALRPVGTHRAWVAPDGSHHFTLEFNDRGRGPVLRQRTVLDAGGTPVDVEISGLSYLKSPVTERFVAEPAGDRWQARWTTPADSGSTEIDAPRHYVAIYDIGDAIHLRALAGAAGDSLALLPFGRTLIDRVGELEVSRGEERRRLRLFAARGLSIVPFFWAEDEDGSVFASDLSLAVGVAGQARHLGMMMRAGWEECAPAYLAAKTAYDSARAEVSAREVGHRTEGALVLRNATLLDVEAGRIRPNATIVLQGNRITAVSFDHEPAIPRGAEVLDLAGRLLTPGMWDLHTHLDDADGLMHLAAGVTTVRDMGGEMEELLARRDRIARGALIGPRVLLGGILDGAGPLATPTTALVSSEPEALAWVRRYADAGYSLVKLYSSLDTSLVAPVIAQATSRGMRVGGHVPQGMTAEAFVRAGATELQHINFLFLNFFADSAGDTRTPARFSVPARLAATLDLDSERVRNFISLLRARDVRVDPTLVVFEAQLTATVGRPFPAVAPVAERLPPVFRRSMLSGGLPVPPGMAQRYRESFTAYSRLVRALFDAGVTILPGTDNRSGFAYHRELELYAAAGIPPMAVLQIATIGAARAMKLDADLGSISAGKLADLVVIDGDPLRDMSQIRRVTLVIRDGVRYVPDSLYATVGITPLRVP